MVQVIPIRTRLSNAYLLVGQKAVLVDTGSFQATGHIIAALRQAGLDLPALSLIMQTHAHYDHCGNTAELKRLSQALVAIHQSECGELKQGKNSAVVPINRLGHLIRPFLMRRYEGVAAEVLMGDELDLRTYGVAARAIHTPGHTPGSVSVITDTGEAIVGDLLGGGLLFGWALPERPRYHYFATDMAAVRLSIKRIMSLSPAKVYVGHGGPLETQAVFKRFASEVGFE